MTLTATERVAWLLRTLDEARSGFHPNAGSGGARLMPKEWTSYYKQIEAALEQLRPQRPVQHNHCMARYRRRAIITNEFPVRKTRQGHQVILPAHHEHERIIEQHGQTALVRVYRWEPWVRQQKADLYLQAIVDHLGAGQIALPPELYARVTGQPIKTEREAVAVAA